MQLPPADDDRFLYEPRALWSVLRPQSQSAATSKLSARVTADKDDFRNVSRYPIVLTRMLVCAINYTFREYTGVALAAPDETNTHNSQAALNLVDVYLSAPFATHITDRDGRVAATPSAGRAASSPRLTGGTPGYLSDLLGVTRWDFDRALMLPRKATIELDLSAISIPNIGFDLLNDPPDVRATIGFDEIHTGKLGGNNRQTARLPVGFMDSTAAANNPFGLDGFAQAAQGDTPVTWPQATRFQAGAWNEQESNRGQYRSMYRGFSVAIDQIAYDEQIQGFAAQYQGDPISPLSTRIATRCKTTNGPSGEWWWRPGAPLALVSPTVTPAVVYDLPVPFVLGPGEELELEAQAPAVVTRLGNEGQPTNVIVTYNVGVSFTGYALIEG